VIYVTDIHELLLYVVMSGNQAVMAKIPLHPKQPERVCWGCDKHCPADALRCGNGTIRTPHPRGLFGDDWLDSELKATGSHSETSKTGQES
jgi:hypothetical protein